jgi:hypothetical protein
MRVARPAEQFLRDANLRRSPTGSREPKPKRPAAELQRASCPLVGLSELTAGVAAAG